MDVDLAATASDTVRRTVKALQGFYDVEPEEIAAALRISKATAYRKINGESEITAGELAVLAQLFGCNIADIYAGTARFDQQRAADLARSRGTTLRRRGAPFSSAAPQTHEADRPRPTGAYLNREVALVTGSPLLTLVPALPDADSDNVTRPNAPERANHHLRVA